MKLEWWNVPAVSNAAGEIGVDVPPDEIAAVAIGELWKARAENHDLRFKLEAAVTILNDLRLSPVQARDRAEKALRPDHVGSRLRNEPQA